VGPWEWPREYFKQHVQIRNEYGFLLDRWGLFFRKGGGSYETTRAGLIIDIFYNTREDIMAKMAEKGQAVFYYFGTGWEYAKPFWTRRPNPDFRGWRVLKEEAELQIINLADRTLPVAIKVRGVAVNGEKKVNIGTSVSHTFRNGQMEEWTIGNTSITRGINVLTLVDPLWELGQAMLLVDEIILEPAPAPDQTPVENP